MRKKKYKKNIEEDKTLLTKITEIYLQFIINYARMVML